MAVWTYITLVNSDASLSKRFRIYAGDGYRPIEEKIEMTRPTVTGAIDHQAGPVMARWEYALKVYHTESDADYGTLAELLSLYRLNDPSPAAGPTNILTLTPIGADAAVSAYLVGKWAPELQGQIPNGTSAVYRVAVTLVQTTAVS